ncbi:VanZ family protein [Heyndrickxia oleronia]|uniref:VanZ family protein n=1 Tax=Heyndrickxia oleronia TaxID=38875 RepID=A0AAW6T4T6_9BACI|nr:VanZ family protein [Heyndrickxia oleronia]MDH5163684.1 VanZ family protein [Heyndrickxia oleronia]
MKKQKIWWAIAIILCVIIYCFTASPESAGSNTQDWIERVTGLNGGAAEVLNFIIRKLTHICIFGLLGILLYFAFRKNKLFFAWFLTTLFAASDEYHQSLVPNRTASVTDVLLDSGGALLAILIVKQIMNKKRANKTNQ